MESGLGLGERILFRLFSHLLALGVGYLVYREFGFWAGAGAAIAVWVLVSVIFGSIIGWNRARKYVNHRRDFK